MAVPPKQEKAESQGLAGRRSTRLFISIPVALSGTDVAGHTFKETTKTLIINRHGAKLATAHQLALGAEVTIENRALARTAKANVVWVGDRASPKDPVEVGLQLTEAQNIWGIEFPPDDWQAGPPIGPGGQKLTKPLPTAPAKAPQAPPAAKTLTLQAVPAAKPPVAKPAVDSSPAPKPAPKPALAPVPTARSIAPPAETANAAIDAAMSRFTQLMEGTAAAQVKSFEAHLAKLTNELGFRTQSSLQEAAGHLQKKTLGSFEQQLGALEGRLRASREA